MKCLELKLTGIKTELNDICFNQISNLLNSRALQTVFASAACLNASFLDEKDHYNTSNKYPGIDLKQARSLFKLLSNVDPQLLNTVRKT